MRFKVFFGTFLALALATNIAGCAIFEGGNVPKTTLTDYADDGTLKPSISYKCSAKGGLFSTSESSDTGQSVIEGELLTVLVSSDYFGSISQDDPSADISMDVTLTNTANPLAMIPAVITGLSLYLIPSWATDNFEVVAKVKRQDGFTKEYTLIDSTTLVQWLPMVFAFPANNFSQIPEVRKNMYRKLLSDMQKDGFFSNYESTASLAD